MITASKILLKSSAVAARGSSLHTNKIFVLRSTIWCANDV